MKEDSLVPREDFPVLKDYVYLDSASISLIPSPVMEATQAFDREIRTAGTVSLGDEEEGRAMEAPRDLSAKLLGTTSSNIAIVQNATEALLQLAWGLKPGKDTNVVSIDLEFPTVLAAWMRVAQDTGLEVRLVQALEKPADLTFDDIAAKVDDDTAVLCISHVQFATGNRFDLKALADLAHSHNAICIIDGTQSTGLIPINVEDAGIDAFFTSAYKWLCGPFGVGILYLRPKLCERIDPPLAGWRSKDDMFNQPGTSLIFAKDARKFDTAGTPNYASGFALAEVIKYMSKPGIDKNLAYVLHLTDKLRRGLEEMGADLAPKEDQLRAGIVSAHFPKRTSKEIVSELRRKQIVVASRLNRLRIAPHIFNNEEDIEQVLGGIRDILS